MTDLTIKYDVFISYSRRDSAQVEILASRLAQEAGLRVWLDRARLRPGFSWREEIETAMNESAATLIAWGPNGLGPVQRQERDLAYVLRDVRSDFRVLYVFLPDTPPPQGTWANVDTWIRFESSLDEADALASIVNVLKGEAPPAQLVAELPDEPAPYRGLAAFGVEDTRFFFGRTVYIDEMLERLPHHPFLAVLGPSGSGKTSLVQAGFLARLKANTIPGSSSWRQLVVRPGPKPLRSLATALARLSPNGDLLRLTDDILSRLQTNPGELPQITQSMMTPEGRLVLVVDRLEEIFTLCRGEEERSFFVKALLALAQHPHRHNWVVATMRADFYGRLGRYADLAGEVVSHQIYIKPMNDEEIGEVIEAPAAQVGAIFEKGLAANVSVDAQAGEEVVLPLLQHTLDLLWRKRRRRWLTWDAYDEVGGVSGALRYHADRVFEGLSPGEKEIARGLFLRLIWLEEGAGALAARRVEKQDLIEQFHDASGAENLLQRLADERLVVLRAEGEQATAELVHDTLPLHWDQLKKWVQEDREFLLWRQRLRSSLNEWERTERDEGALLRGVSLIEAERWLDERPDDITPDESGLINESVKRREGERKTRERRRRKVTIGLIAGLMIALVLAGLAGLQWRRAEEQATIANSRWLAAQAATKVESEYDLSLLLSVLSYAGGIRTSEATSTLMEGIETYPRLLRYLWGHEGWVVSVAFSPDGKSLASGGNDRSVILWDVENKEMIGKPLKGHVGPVTSVAFGNDGKLMASGGVFNDRSVILWNVEKREMIGKPLKGHEGPVQSVAFSNDGMTIASRGIDGSVILFDLEAESRINKACFIANRNLTWAEWRKYMGDEEQYNMVCDKNHIHPSFVEHGRDLAKSGKIREATAVFKRANELEPDLGIDPEAEAKKLASESAVKDGAAKQE